MSTAQDQVIATPELLELILAQLPTRDLLVSASVVSKTWQATTRTPTLQRTLFFLPNPSSEPVQNPLLAELFHPFFTVNSDCVSRTWSGPGGNAATLMAMPWAKAPEAFKRADASWRRMLVIQSPAQTMLVTSFTRGRPRRRVVLKDLEALRMGILYDIAVTFVDRRSRSFHIHWHHCNDVDVALAINHLGCIRGGRRGWLDEQFYSDGRVEINVGEWEELDVW
ncbi:hypothetical protein B0H12DRAFT_1320651 [Mycena haematopus]|nr:hypothetical protein B0H12DRAFT_1320651 [Mycena haematopus]